MVDKAKIKRIDDLWYKALTCKVLVKNRNNYEVASPSGAIYDVRIDGSYIRTCNCMAGQNNPVSGCSHVVAAFKTHVERKGYEVIWLVPAGSNWGEQGADGVYSVNPWMEMMYKKIREGEEEYVPEVEEPNEEPPKANWFDSF